MCEGCVSKKHHGEKFDKEPAWRASYSLELMHTDLCGPMQNESIGGNRCFYRYNFKHLKLNKHVYKYMILLNI
jgi:hypothetical protein